MQNTKEKWPPIFFIFIVSKTDLRHRSHFSAERRAGRRAGDPARLIANAADVELGGHDETAGRNAARNDVLAPHVMPVARNSVMD